MAAPEVQADVETSDMKTPESADVAAAAAADADAGDAAAAEPAAAAEEEAAEASDGGGGGGEAAAAGSLAAVEAAAAAWFDRKVFTKPDFDASRYVDEMSPYVSMDTLKGELESYLTDLQRQLVDLVNRDYEKFVSLSTDLVDVESAIEDWEAPVAAFKEEVLNTRAAVQQVLEEMNDALRRRQENAERRATLELMLDTNNVVSKVERLLEELGEEGAAGAGAVAGAGTSGGGGGDGDGGGEDEDIITAEDEDDLDMLKPRLAGGAEPSALALAAEDGGGRGKGKGNNNDNHARLLERISSEVNRLRFFQGKGKHLKFIIQLEPRIEACEAKLARAVKAALATAIHARSKAALGHCLHAYTAVGRVHEAEEMIRTRLVAPAVKAVLAAAPPAAALGAREDLAPLLNSCSTAALASCAIELELTRDVESGLAAQYNLLANAVLAEVDTQLAAARPAAYSPGVPDAFHRNHGAALSLVDSLEERVPTRASLALFRYSPALAAYTKRWNLSVGL